MILLIKPLIDLAKKYYSKHNHFHKGDAGLDLYILKDQTIKAGETVKIKLGISCENIDGKGYLLFPRSSISKTPLRLANSIGLIDWGYRGEIMAVCDNIKDYDFSISKGDRLFQIVSSDMSSIEFEIANELSETTRASIEKVKRER